MGNYLLTSILSGLAFGLLDGVINVNPYAQKLFEVYKPIAKTSINAPLGLVIDLVYGFTMTAIFLLLYKALPGETGWFKGLSFGLMAWFFRVVMYTLSQAMMFEIPLPTLFYMLITGLGEMLLIGLLIGFVLRIH